MKNKSILKDYSTEVEIWLTEIRFKTQDKKVVSWSKAYIYSMTFYKGTDTPEAEAEWFLMKSALKILGQTKTSKMKVLEVLYTKKEFMSIPYRKIKKPL